MCFDIGAPFDIFEYLCNDFLTFKMFSYINKVSSRFFVGNIDRLCYNQRRYIMNIVVHVLVINLIKISLPYANIKLKK